LLVRRVRIPGEEPSSGKAAHPSLGEQTH